MKHLFHIPVHGIQDLVPASVLPEALIHASGEVVQVQLIQFIIQQLRRLKHIQFPRRFLLDQPDTAEAVIALLRLIEHTASGPHSLQDLILLQEQQIALQRLQVPFCIHIINLRKNFLQIRIMFSYAVLTAHPSGPVRRHGEGQAAIPK